MRRAYIGISSPLAYDTATTFKVPYTKAASDNECSYNGIPYPNPILESPYGLLLLYDEIWFLSRSLCPLNMQGLPYVKFVIETPYAKSLIHKYVNYDDPPVRDLFQTEEMFQLTHMKWGQQFVEGIPMDWGPSISNKSEIFMISNSPMMGMTSLLESLMIDLLHMSHLGIEGLELITNRHTTPIAEHLMKATNRPIADRINNRMMLAEEVLLNRIPDYVSKEGPYHPCVEEARADRFLVEFRKWVSSHSPLQSESEIKDVVHDANEAFRRLQHKLFEKHLSKSQMYFSIGKNFLYSFIDLFFSGFGTAAGSLESVKEGRKAEKIRWQGFLASQEFLHRS